MRALALAGRLSRERSRRAEDARRIPARRRAAPQRVRGDPGGPTPSSISGEKPHEHAQDSVSIDRVATSLGDDGARERRRGDDRRVVRRPAPPAARRRVDGKSSPGSRSCARPKAELAESISRAERRAFSLPLSPVERRSSATSGAPLPAVPYGETIAYRDLAARIGRPGSIRAAGAATDAIRCRSSSRATASSAPTVH
jgi:O6-methylguanine-DNA--protein-cysteine methyltransferase